VDALIELLKEARAWMSGTEALKEDSNMAQQTELDQFREFADKVSKAPDFEDDDIPF